MGWHLSVACQELGLTARGELCPSKAPSASAAPPQLHLGPSGFRFSKVGDHCSTPLHFLFQKLDLPEPRNPYCLLFPIGQSPVSSAGHWQDVILHLVQCRFWDFWTQPEIWLSFFISSLLDSCLSLSQAESILLSKLSKVHCLPAFPLLPL